MKYPSEHVERSIEALVVVRYHREQFTQQTIASQLGMSVGTINRILAKAKERGWVRTTIHLPNDAEIEANILELFNKSVSSPVAVVVDVKDDSHSVAVDAVGEAAARYFESVVFQGAKVAIDGGKTICRLIESINQPLKDIRLYPVAGGPLDSEFTSVHALIGRFLGKLGSKSGLSAVSLPAPTENVLSQTQRSPGISNRLKEAAQSDFFLLGIGAVGSDDLTPTVEELLQTLRIDPVELRQKGVIGICAYTAFDSEGKIIGTSFDRSVFKVPPKSIIEAAKQYHPKRHVILAASGMEKAIAIRAALKGGLANCLITDKGTAEAVLLAAKRM